MNLALTADKRWLLEKPTTNCQCSNPPAPSSRCPLMYVIGGWTFSGGCQSLLGMVRIQYFPCAMLGYPFPEDRLGQPMRSITYASASQSHGIISSGATVSHHRFATRNLHCREKSGSFSLGINSAALRTYANKHLTFQN